MAYTSAMEPRIQYAKTSDGVNIAYCEYGRGEPALVVLIDLPLSHTQLEPGYGFNWPGFFDSLGRRGIRLDPRGMGMSDRDVERFSLDDWVLDLEAVVDRLKLDHFILMASGSSGVIAIAFAARHPERVSHLVLINATARPADAYSTPASQSLGALLATDWEMFTENVGALGFGWGHEAARAYGEYIRACATREVVRATVATLARIDLTGSLASLTMPTLVIHNAAIKLMPLEVVRKLVPAIPNAQLAVVEGVYSLELDQFVEPVRQFLQADSQPEEEVQRHEPSSFRTVLFTDLVGHTEMMSRLGDDRGRGVLREHESISREVLKANGGTEVKTMGDGFMASFGSVTKAVECAIALQRAFADREGEPLSVRVGLNAGEPIEEDGDLFGATVILASRIAAKAEGGEILVADTVRGLCSGKGFFFADRGEFNAKGIDEPVRVSEVRWRE